MDSSDPYFWQTAVSSGSDSSMIPNSVDGFIQQAQIIPQQQQDSNDSSKATSLITAVSSSSQNVYVQQNVQHTTVSAEAKGDRSMTTQNDSMLPIEIVNPDAIEPKPRSYTCRICQVTFPNKSAVTVHSRLHTDHQGKPYRCNFCGKGFSTNFYLKQHERIHSGQKPYKCPMCDNSFKQLSHVQQHVRTHTGVRPYKCHWPGCGKAFLQQSHLKSHEARHTPKSNTGVRPYKCHWPDCGKSFAQLNNLKSHVARHTPGKSKSKSKANANAASKSATETVEDASNPFAFASNVINQAAAAANIVPVAAADEEAEIRPYLCPGCSKLYVREATFKKHLEECKTKLQLSISATANALGIDPPPIPSASNAVNEYDAPLLQITSIPVEESAPKRPRLHVKLEEVVDQQQELHIAIRSNDRQDISVSPPSISHVKQEPLGDAVNFVSRQGLAQDSEFKLPQVISTSSATQPTIYHVQSVAPQVQTQNVLAFHIDDRQKQVHIHPTSTLAQQQNIILTTTGSGQAVSLVSTLPQAPHSSLAQPVTSSSNAPKDEQEHSTINQAAIRWQWDQPVPRLNYP